MENSVGTKHMLSTTTFVFGSAKAPLAPRVPAPVPSPVSLLLVLTQIDKSVEQRSN